MPFTHFGAFQPGSDCHLHLHDWIDFYTRRQLFWKAFIILKKEEVPQICLGRAGSLGYTSWLGSLPFQHDPCDYQIRGGGLSTAENS
jgi:type VI secretion system protein ImpH